MPPLDPQAPEDRGRFDRGVVLFNAGAFYDAHEDWEDLWHEAEGAERLWLQGLIQIAAAFVHWSRGFHASGFARLLEQAREKVDGYAGRTWGVDWPRLKADLAPWYAHGRVVAAGADLKASGPASPPQVHAVPGYEIDPLPIEE
ncbi:MAG: DUF309 domain-containing protein [Planctomycetota bacterium]